ncbi:hypothetical protein KIL84_009891 [Mauremys mutica]|uniref:Uncharacterized protein n=1 Tax=Mauremys mutica TaxID=74926 RepID=A0A9D3XLH5_9SAUR|nr:hypothetical protein KIL84_009891 [Mauremys mutica]
MATARGHSTMPWRPREDTARCHGDRARTQHRGMTLRLLATLLPARRSRGKGGGSHMTGRPVPASHVTPPRPPPVT